MIRFSAGRRHPIQFTLNGRAAEAEAEPRMLLSDFLRQLIGATGTHVGCEHGVCGACTVVVDGMLTRACLTLAVQIGGCDVQTVEGLAASADQLGILQRAFRRNHALQCGFCTPGILMSLDHYLSRNPMPSEGDIRDSQPDISLATNALGYRPRVSFEEGLGKTWEWFWANRGE